jgi:hypothetical protein
MGVRIDYVDNLAVCGQFIHEERRVEIRTGLTPVMERSVLAHEAAHAELRHEQQDLWCHRLQQERMASAMAGRRLIDFRKFMKLHADGASEKEMSVELGIARSIMRASLWMAAPALQAAA